jgi:hypothetical protein
MSIFILACLLAMALIAVALHVGLALSWLISGAVSFLAVALVVAAVLYFLGASFRDHLIDDLGSLYKRWSTRIAGLQLTSAVAFWGLAPPEWKAAVPNWALLAMMAFFGLAFMTAQGIKQPSLTPPAE